MADSHIEASRRLMDFIHASPTPYHAVLSLVGVAEDAGFRRLEETAPWELAPGDRRYVVRNDGSVALFIVGDQPAADAGFRIVGAHTDSPNLRIKPRAERTSHGYRQLGVEVYGGALIATWADRDLGIAGRVAVLSDGTVENRLVRVDRCVARVPRLAIHLDREVTQKGLLLNKERHLRPVIGLEDSSPDFMEWIAGEAGVGRRDDILGFDLMLFDLTPPCFGGLARDFVHAPRLDNLAMCHAGLVALLAATPRASATRIAVFHDHEEVGSNTAEGAAGSLLDDLTRRIACGMGDGEDALVRARSRSFLVSADMAHAVHPNYADRHDDHHMPRLNGGPVIKINANARYATDAGTAGRFARICRDADIPVQRFAMRSDLACGSTIGPIVATRLGIRTVDIGNPQLSMHSCREMAGSRDHEWMCRAMTRFFDGSD